MQTDQTFTIWSWGNGGGANNGGIILMVLFSSCFTSITDDNREIIDNSTDFGTPKHPRTTARAPSPNSVVVLGVQPECQGKCLSAHPFGPLFKVIIVVAEIMLITSTVFRLIKWVSTMSLLLSWRSTRKLFPQTRLPQLTGALRRDGELLKY